MTLGLLFLASIAVAIAYVFLITKYLDGWTGTVEKEGQYSSSTSVSVIVAAYNEADKIEKCVRSILASEYPEDLLQVIVVDNGSTDETNSILQQFNDPRLLVLTQSEGNKKESIELGISRAKNEFLLFTDADCVVGKHWVSAMVRAHEREGADCVLGPLEIMKYNDLQTRFQAFDMLAMMGVTCGGLKKEINYLANGANFGYTQKLYNTINEIPHKEYASGDDVFMLHEFIKSGNAKLVFQKHKDAIVGTQAVKTWKELIHQRIRWASKAKSYVQQKDVYINAFVFGFCAMILANVLLIPFTGGASLFIAIFQLFIKGVIDYAFIDRVNKFFGKKHLMKYFLPSFLVHYCYIIFSGCTSLLGISYKWKDKRLK